MTSNEIYAGVMSGTSLDGVDAVVADFASAEGAVCRTLGHAHVAFAMPLREVMLALASISSRVSGGRVTLRPEGSPIIDVKSPIRKMTW